MNNEEKILTIPYVVYESEQSRQERHIKRLIVALVIALVLLFASNALWLVAWSSYDYESIEEVKTVKVDAKDGVANYVGNNGDINNGQCDSEGSETEKNTQEEE